jgi:hypothetical protein
LFPSFTRSMELKQRPPGFDCRSSGGPH